MSLPPRASVDHSNGSRSSALPGRSVAHCQAGDFQHQATTRFDDSLAASEEKSLGPRSPGSTSIRSCLQNTRARLPRPRDLRLAGLEPAGRLGRAAQAPSAVASWGKHRLRWRRQAICGLSTTKWKLPNREVQMSSGYKSISVTHRSRAGLSLTREVRWYPSNRQAYRWSEQEGRWVYLGHTDSLDEARYLASIDMFNAQRRDN
jgi:hypothetical protein